MAPMNVTVLPDASSERSVSSMPTGPNSARSAMSAGVSPVAASSTADSDWMAELLYAHVWPGGTSWPRPTAKAFLSGARNSST